MLIDEIWAVQGRYAVNPPQYGERIELLPAPIPIIVGTNNANLAWGPVDITDLPAVLAPPLDDFSAAPSSVIGCVIRMSMDVTGAPAGVMATQHRMYVDIPAAGALIPASFAWLHPVYGAMEHTTDIVVRDTVLTGGVNVGDAFAFDYRVELIGWVLTD